MSVVLAVLSAVFAALTSILAKAGIREISSNLATAIRTGVVLVVAALMCALFGNFDFGAIDGRAWLFLTLSGVATGLSWLCYFRALQLGSVSKVVPIDKLSTVFVMIFAYIFLHETATVTGVAGGALVAAGAVLMAAGKTEDGKRSRTAVVLALLSAVFAAATSIFAKIGIDGISSNLATFVRTAVVLVFAWAIVFARGEARGIKEIRGGSLGFLLASGVTTGLSWLCYFAAISIGKVSVVAPIDKFSVVLTILFGFLILKEPVRKKEIAACIMITAGIVLLIL